MNLQEQNVGNPQSQLRQALALLEAGEAQHRVLAQLLNQSRDWPTPLSERLALSTKFLSRTGASAQHLLNQLLKTQNEWLAFDGRLSLALQAPVLTARLMKWLPLVSVSLAQVAGLNPLSFLVFEPLGWVLVIVATALNWSGARWSRNLVSRAADSQENTSEPACELTAMALLAGMSVRQALQEAGSVYPGSMQQVQQVVNEHRFSGLALHTLLFAKAAELRIQVQNRRELLVAQLPVKLLAPMGILYLPAFMSLTVVPVAVTALTNR
ncbi:MAG: hypothetical protein ACKORF_06605 [Micrococcales bacterium]